LDVVTGKELALYRLESAEERLKAARLLLEKQMYADAVSRVYYAVFQAARAALATKELDSRKHSGIIGLFLRQMIATGWQMVKLKINIMSGHMFFADEYFGYDDALYTTGRLLRILSHTEKSLSGLLEDAPKYCSAGETRMPCSDLDKFEVVNQLTCEFQEQYEVIDIDGARVLFPEGWALVRCSNTQPVIVARCEANSPEALDKIKKIMEGTLHSYPQIGVFDWE
jgi:uncharacterized protein (UPF0332 family)